MPATGAYASDVAARLGDFFDPRSHWQRRLWNAGLVMQLGEVVEASDQVRAGALSQEALGWLVDRVRRQIAQDPGVGDRAQQKALIDCLSRDLTTSGLNYLMLKELERDINASYLERWANALQADPLPKRERTARALAAYVLDLGLGPGHLKEWLDTYAAQAGDGLDIAALFDDASRVVATPLVMYEALVPFAVEPSSRASRPQEWIDSRQAAKWLSENGFADKRPQQRGGLLIRVEARDQEGAVSMAVDTVDRFRARVVVGTSSPFEFLPHMYFAGGLIADQARPRRNVEVHALTRADRVYALGTAGAIDSALELLAHLETAPPPVAVAAGWSVIESLLVGPGGKPNVIAADRLASLVACSWPRAELTDLAWAKSLQRDEPVSREISALRSNREKAHHIATLLAAGQRIALNRPSDVAAVRRMANLVANPRAVLTDVKEHAVESFRRLYRVRNIILHGGQVSPVALNATLRTAPPLVGAGIDRITHAYLVEDRSPLEIAARAELEIARAGSAEARALTELLE